jgi:hypothetical protein
MELPFKIFLMEIGMKVNISMENFQVMDFTNGIMVLHIKVSFIMDYVMVLGLGHIWIKFMKVIILMIKNRDMENIDGVDLIVKHTIKENF